MADSLQIQAPDSTSQTKKPKNPILAKINEPSMTYSPAFNLFYSEIDSANKLLLKKDFEGAKKKFRDIAECFEKTSWLQQYMNFSIMNFLVIDRTTPDGREVKVKIRPNYVYKYAASMANMLDSLCPSEDIAKLMVNLWDAGTHVENINKRENEDIIPGSKSKLYKLMREIKTLAKQIDPTVNANLKPKRGIVVDDGFDGEMLNEFKGLFKPKDEKSKFNYSNPLYVAEDRYLRMLEWLDEKPRESVKYKNEALSSIPEKTNTAH